MTMNAERRAAISNLREITDGLSTSQIWRLGIALRYMKEERHLGDWLNLAGQIVIRIDGWEGVVRDYKNERRRRRYNDRSNQKA
jgi:hypothetical protein